MNRLMLMSFIMVAMVMTAFTSYDNEVKNNELSYNIIIVDDVPLYQYEGITVLSEELLSQRDVEFLKHKESEGVKFISTVKRTAPQSPSGSDMVCDMVYKTADTVKFRCCYLVNRKNVCTYNCYHILPDGTTVQYECTN